MTTALADVLAPAAWPACTSALRLDRLLAGELPVAEADDLRGHLAGCPRCAAALAELTAARDAAPPPLRLVAPGREVAAPAPRRAARRWAATAVAAAALAAAAVIAVRPGLEGERTKGAAAPAWSAFVLHDGAVRRAGPGEVVAPGDALRFAVTAPAPGYVAVLSLDPVGRASVYYPAGAEAAPVAGGGEVALPLATRLDATVGEERLFGLSCPAPVTLEPLRAELERSGRLEPLPAGCQVTGWRLEKR